MQEVTIRLRFSRECLGSVKRKREHDAILCMPRDGCGRVLFLPTWWQHRMLYAAQVANRHQKLVRKIDWDPVIDGTPRNDFRRYLPSVTHQRCNDKPYRARLRFVVHEAFATGDTVGVNAVIPDGMPLEDFRRLLDIVGAYKGMSPYKPDERYGTFEVMSVEPRRRAFRQPAADATAILPVQIKEPAGG